MGIPVTLRPQTGLMIEFNIAGVQKRYDGPVDATPAVARPF